MTTPHEHTNGDNLTRRMHNLDNYLDDVFAADLDDPQRSTAFLAKVERRAAPAPIPAATPHQILPRSGPRITNRLTVGLAHLLALILVAAGVFATIAIQAHYWTAIAAATAFAVEAAAIHPRSPTVRRRNRR